MKRRDDLMRITEILIAAKNPIVPTRLMNFTNHSYDPFIKTIERLLRIGLLELVPGIPRDGRNKGRYRTTELGEELIAQALVCYRLIEDEYGKKIIKKIRVA